MLLLLFWDLTLLSPPPFLPLPAQLQFYHSDDPIPAILDDLRRPNSLFPQLIFRKGQSEPFYHSLPHPLRKMERDAGCREGDVKMCLKDLLKRVQL